MTKLEQRVVTFCGPDWPNVHDRGKWWWSIGNDEDGYEADESSAYEAVARALRGDSEQKE